MVEDLTTHVVGMTIEHKFCLAAAGITTPDELVERAATRRGREELARELDVDTAEILEWMNRVDLMRIDGVDAYYADLLEEAGVDTVVELAQRNQENLHESLSELVKKMPFIVDEEPSLEQVKSWIQQAKTLDRLIEY